MANDPLADISSASSATFVPFFFSAVFYFYFIFSLKEFCGINQAVVVN